MNYAEFWILETAVEYGVPLSLIHGPIASVEAQWNKPFHGQTRDELITSLVALVDQGDIVVADEIRDVCLSTHSEIDECLQWKRFHPSATYRLTPQGGARWEKFAAPDWACFHSYDWDQHNEEFLEIGALTPQIAQRAFEYSAAWNGLDVDSETLHHRSISPWQATYWKSFEHGHIIRFKCSSTAQNDFHRQRMKNWSDGDICRVMVHVHSEYRYFANWYSPHPEQRRSGDY